TKPDHVPLPAPPRAVHGHTPLAHPRRPAGAHRHGLRWPPPWVARPRRTTTSRRPAARSAWRCCASTCRPSATGSRRVVVHDPAGEPPAPTVLEELAQRLDAIDHVALVSTPTSPTGTPRCSWSATPNPSRLGGSDPLSRPGS